MTDETGFYCTNGHTDIPHEVMEALARQNLSPNEWRVLMVILRLTWGWHKKKDRIPLSQFVKRTGIKKQNASNTLARLIERNMVMADYDSKGTTYRFQEKFERWRGSLSPMTISKSIKKMRRVIVTYDAGSLSPMTKSSLSPMTSKENKEMTSKEREKGEGSPLTPSPSIPSSKEENPKTKTAEQPIFLQDQMKDLQKGKGKLRYVHPKRSRAQHRKMLEEQRENLLRTGRAEG